MSRKPNRGSSSVDQRVPIRFFVVSPPWWAPLSRHIVMFQIEDKTPCILVRFWSWDSANDFVDGCNLIVRGGERPLFGRLW